MTRTLKTTRNEIEYFVSVRKLLHVLAPRSRAAFVLSALVLAGMSGAFSSSARAQEAHPNLSGPHKADLSQMVVVGDSLSAGFQSDSLLDSQQPNGWASLVAAQAGVPLVLPLIAPPGFPPVLVLVSPGPPPIIVPSASVPSLVRDNPNDQATDLAVPGAELQDVLTTAPSLPIDDLTDLVLGIPGLNDTPSVSLTQVEWAQALKPTTIFVWIGNNDILGAASAANPSGATSLTSFASNYDKMLNDLSATGATVVVANIPDVTAVPYFTPASTIAEEVGLPLFVIGPILGIGPGEYVLPAGVALIPGILADPSTGPLPASDVLTAIQVLEVRGIVDAYNLIIAIEAATHGAVVVDIHSLANQIRSQGVEADGKHLTNAFLGGIFSLDGIHPTNTGYAVIANLFITTLNRTRGTSVPLVNVNAVAAGDPLVPAEVLRIGSLGQHVGPATAEALRPLLQHKARQ
ncbi:MAG: GDSL-type esterase/lipase family protein [Candidatus Acidiferrales bacterium]